MSSESIKQHIGSLIRIIICIVLIVIIFTIIANRMLFTTSEQAFINSRLTSLRAELSGTVINNAMTVGETITKGQHLLEIKNPYFGNSNLQIEKYRQLSLINTLTVNIRQTKLALKKLKDNRTRIEKLRGTGSVADIELDDAANDINIMRSKFINTHMQLGQSIRLLRDINTQLKLLRHNTVTAPENGVIWTLFTKNGEHINEGDELVRIISPEDVWVDAFFNEQSASKLSPGMAVTIEEIGSERSWTGTIVFIRAGSGRVNYNSVVETPPSAMARRLIAVRIKVDWKGVYTASEFFGIGRSMIVKHSHRS